MKKTNTNSLLKYLYYIALFILAYFLLFFIWNKYNEYRKIEKFTGGLPIMSSNNNANIAAWIGVILAGCLIIGIFVYFIKEANEKNKFNKAANKLGKELDSNWSSSSSQKSH
jgi:NADH:ubiquinone oxidoreductase subunit 6 (subunit J)